MQLGKFSPNPPDSLLVLSCPRCTLSLGLWTRANEDEVVLFFVVLFAGPCFEASFIFVFCGGKTAPEAEAGDEAAALQSSFTSLL